MVSSQSKMMTATRLYWWRGEERQRQSKGNLLAYLPACLTRFDCIASRRWRKDTLPRNGNGDQWSGAHLGLPLDDLRGGGDMIVLRLGR